MSLWSWYWSPSTVLASQYLSYRSRGQMELLAAVILQDVWVLLPELVSYNVTVVGLHSPPAASNSHIFLPFIWQLHAFRDSFLSLKERIQYYE